MSFRVCLDLVLEALPFASDLAQYSTILSSGFAGWGGDGSLELCDLLVLFVCFGVFFPCLKEQNEALLFTSNLLN